MPGAVRRNLSQGACRGGLCPVGGLFGCAWTILANARQAQQRPIVVGGAVLNQRIERAGDLRLAVPSGAGADLRDPGQQLVPPLETAADLAERKAARQLILTGLARLSLLLGPRPRLALKHDEDLLHRRTPS